MPEDVSKNSTRTVIVSYRCISSNDSSLCVSAPENKLMLFQVKESAEVTLANLTSGAKYDVSVQLLGDEAISAAARIETATERTNEAVQHARSSTCKYFISERMNDKCSRNVTHYVQIP